MAEQLAVRVVLALFIWTALLVLATLAGLL
jgi:hypothetical protein